MKTVYTLEDLRRWGRAGNTLEAAMPEGVCATQEPHPIRLAVVGDPVAHSISPQMQNAALEACALPLCYARLHIRPEELPEALPLLPKAGFLGANFTIPHKVALLELLDEVDERARRLGAVNTVRMRDGRMMGFNTDGPGLARAVKAEFGVELSRLRVMILGAGGGAGRAIATQCVLEQCVQLTLVNRTLEKAEQVARELLPLFHTPTGNTLTANNRVAVIPWEEDAIAAQLAATDLLIQATSRGMNPDEPSLLPASILPPHLLVYDAVYTAALTPLLKAARSVGARTANGASMLLYQGALAFEIWFNRPAPVEVMRRAMEKAMGG